MDDLVMVRELGNDTPLPAPHELAPARDMLMSAISAETGAQTRAVRPSRRRRPARRLAFAGWATAGLAAAVTAVLALAPGVTVTRTGPDGTAAPGPGDTGRAAPAMLPASQVLENAAVAALKAPDIKPRPGQFLYTKITSVTDDEYNGSTQETWESMDGTHDGLTVRVDKGVEERTPLPGCRGGRRAVSKADRTVSGSEPCTPDPAYRPELPTDADAMAAYLRKDKTQKTPDSVTNAIGKDVLLLASRYLRPAQRAALFRAATTIPGLSVVPDATDGAGRRGVGIRWSYTGGTPHTLVFDAGTYEFIGMSGAITVTAIVDKVGQRR